MLVALSDAGERRIAERGMTAEPFRCPMCEGRVILKRGRNVAAHFAHLPGALCPYAEAESWRHLLAKQVLMEEFHKRGWYARLEVAHPDVGRRVDVGVRVPDGRGGFHYVAIEIQDSAIGVETMKKRVALDKRKNYAATAWLFTSHRAAGLLVAAGTRIEVRVPKEMLWVVNRYGQGVPVIDPEQRAIQIAPLARVMRVGESYSWFEPGGIEAGVDYPDRVLRSTHTVLPLREGGFDLSFARGRFDRSVVVFGNESATSTAGS